MRGSSKSLRLLLLLPVLPFIAWFGIDRVGKWLTPNADPEIERLTEAARDPAQVEGSMIALAHLAAYSSEYPASREFCGSEIEQSQAARTSLHKLGKAHPKTLLKLLTSWDPSVRVAAFFIASSEQTPGAQPIFKKMSREDPVLGLRKYAQSVLRV